MGRASQVLDLYNGHTIDEAKKAKEPKGEKPAPKEKVTKEVKKETNSTAGIEKQLKTNKWTSKPTSDKSPTIDKVWINKGGKIWLWFDNKSKKWHYSDNPNTKTYKPIKETEIQNIIKKYS